jgi:hypothetical protein
MISENGNIKIVNVFDIKLKISKMETLKLLMCLI